MKNSYIINHGYYIKNDLKSLLIYYDYFSQGISLPKIINHKFISKILHIFIRYLIFALYKTNLHTVLYKKIKINDNAVIIVNGKGKWRSTIKLIEKENKLLIVKKIKNNLLFKNEMKFYNKYKTNNSNIKLPICKFIKHSNQIEMEFLRLKSFQRLINEGTYNFNDSLDLLNKINCEIKSLYKTNFSLVHGDLWPENIYVDENQYYLIDYTDSHTNLIRYDSYTLLYALLLSYKYIRNNTKTIQNIIVKGKRIVDTLNLSKKTLLSIEEKFYNYRINRFPNLYNA